ncbi:MAG: hypothetical protein K0R49_1072 [Burkholderiales bacterium]|jgi:hypothetical protein|nr:hypothetical protein [Burkholderiales bacterium]
MRTLLHKIFLDNNSAPKNYKLTYLIGLSIVLNVYMGQAQAQNNGLHCVVNNEDDETILKTILEKYGVAKRYALTQNLLWSYQKNQKPAIFHTINDIPALSYLKHSESQITGKITTYIRYNPQTHKLVKKVGEVDTWILSTPDPKEKWNLVAPSKDSQSAPSTLPDDGLWNLEIYSMQDPKKVDIHLSCDPDFEKYDDDKSTVYEHKKENNKPLPYLPYTKKDKDKKQKGNEVYDILEQHSDEKLKKYVCTISNNQQNIELIKSLVPILKTYKGDIDDDREKPATIEWFIDTNYKPQHLSINGNGLSNDGETLAIDSRQFVYIFPIPYKTSSKWATDKWTFTPIGNSNWQLDILRDEQKYKPKDNINGLMLKCAVSEALN